MKRPITLYDVRNLINQFDRAEITMSRFTEIMNEKVEAFAKSEYDNGYHAGYADANREATQEIHKNYHPNV